MTVAIRDRYETNVNGIWVDDGLDFHPDLEGEALNLHCMPIQILGGSRIPSLKSDRQFHCLLLQPTTLRRGQFRRYGTMYLDMQAHSIKEWNNIQNGQWFQFEEHDGNGMDTITII